MAVLVAVLAAGLATRFGGGKLDADCAGKPLGSWVLQTVEQAGFVPGIIVTGPVAPTFTAKAEGWKLITNRDPAAGLGTSLALAAAQAKAASRDLLVLLADMPLIAPAHLKALTAEKRVAATHYPDGRPGVPAYFPQSSLEQLVNISGERGASAILRQNAQLSLIAAEAETLLDVDRPQDLETVSRILSRH